MIITTANTIEGHDITSSLGIVHGLFIRNSMGKITNFLGGFKRPTGEQVHAHTQMCNDARTQAYDLMIQQATALAADAIIAMRYDTNKITTLTTEIFCYGSAVKLRKNA